MGLRDEFEKAFGPTLRDVAESRKQRGYGNNLKVPYAHQSWQVLRVMEAVNDREFEVWLVTAAPHEIGPVFEGYELLCKALAEPRPEAEAALTARRAMDAGFPLACRLFVRWWFLTNHRA